MAGLIQLILGHKFHRLVARVARTAADGDRLLGTAPRSAL